MELSQQSTEMARASTLVADLGFTLKQVLLDALIGSEESLVILEKSTNRIVGIAGASQAFRGDTTVVLPWFYSTGFETNAPVWFLMRMKATLAVWERWARGKVFLGEYPSNKQTARLLRYLGFTVSTGTRKGFMRFTKKGGSTTNVYNSPNDNTERRLITHGNQGKE